MREKAMSPRYAGFWIRLVADLLDSLILTLASGLLELVLLGAYYWIKVGVLTLQGRSSPSFDDSFNSLTLQMFNVSLYFILAFPYYYFGHLKWGTTLGKRPFRIYVVSATEYGPLTPWQSVLRFFGYGLSYAVFCTGFLMAAFHPQKKGFHDLMAGTVSIRRRPE